MFSYPDWTSLYDVSPMRETLAEVCDFNQLNDPTHMRIAVTATNVQTGDQVCFANFVGNPDSVYYVTPRISRVSLTPDHILASGSLPPGFPMTVIDGVPYWDGGLFDNTPIESMLDLLTERTGKPSDLHCQPVRDSLKSPSEPARGAGADAGNQLRESFSA